MVFRVEEERRARVAAELRKAGLTGFRFKVSVETMSARSWRTCLRGWSVERGRIEVRCDGAVDALAQLYTLAQALGNDLGRFQAARRSFESAGERW